VKRDKVKEVQHYLAERGIKASEVAIIDAAITIARRLGAGDHTFELEFIMEKKGE
jgi:hypothetical protein